MAVAVGSDGLRSPDKAGDGAAKGFVPLTPTRTGYKILHVLTELALNCNMNTFM